MRILKFGGKSLDSPEKVQNICKFIKKIYKKDKKIIIIVSAMGKTTDNLINIAKTFYKNNPSRRELDVILSTGETQSSALFSLALNSIGLPAKSFQAFQLNIKTFGDFQNSLISSINKNALVKCIENDSIAIVSGFQGINKNNEITTLGRGGSDTTAAAIGAIFNHDIEIYSDYDGVFAGDPKILNYKKIKKINYDSMKKIASSGAKVLEKRSVKIANKFNFNIYCKQSSNPTLSGTKISTIEDSFISITETDNLSKISIDYSNNINKENLIKNVLKCLNNINYYNFNIKPNNITFLINTELKTELINKLSTKLKLLKNN